MFGAYFNSGKPSIPFSSFALPAFCEIIIHGVMAMELDEAARTEKEERRLLAVLALLRGKPAAQICQQYSICLIGQVMMKAQGIIMGGLV